MAIPLLNLDDRTFSEMMEEVQALIPRCAPAWTNYNLSDPGITIMELFAWATEAMLFRINRVPEASRRRFLELLGAVHQTAQPAVLKLRVCAALEAGETIHVPRHTVVHPRLEASKAPLPFETVDEVTFSADLPLRTVVVRQTAPVEVVDTLQGNGMPFQLVRLPQPIYIPKLPFPWPPVVLVDRVPWQYVQTLRASAARDQHFAIRPKTNTVVFGNGVKGMIPPPDAQITVTYRTSRVPQVILRNQLLGVSRGRPQEVFRLPAPVLPSDLQPRSELEPRVEVEDEPWEYCANILDFEAQIGQFAVEPWCNGLRFGDGSRGRIPPHGAKIAASYRTTLGPIEPLPARTRFHFGIKPEWARQLTIDAITVIEPGANATSLDNARQQAFAMIKPAWRGVTAADFGTIVMREQPDVHRVQCMAGDDLGAAAGRRLPAQLGVLVTPKPRCVRRIAAAAPGRSIELAPDGRSLLTLSPDGDAWLWNLENSGPYVPLTSGGVRQAAYSSDGRRIAVLTQDDYAGLYDAATGDLLCQPTAGDELAPVKISMFSGDGRRWLTVGADEGALAVLRAADDGAAIQVLPIGTPIEQAVFTPDSSRLVTLQRGDELSNGLNYVRLWDAKNGSLLSGEPWKVNADRLFVSPDSRWLAAVAGDGRTAIRELGQETKPREIVLAAPVEILVFSPNGTRLATITADGRARLWSLRTGRLIAALDPPGGVAGVRFSPDGRWLAAYDWEGRIAIWQAQPGRCVFNLAAGSAVLGLTFNAAGSRLAAAAERAPMLLVWDLAHGGLQLLACTAATAAALNSQGKWAAWVEDNLVSVWDLEADRVAATLHHSREETGLCLAAPLVEGDLLLTLTGRPECDTRSVQVWNAGYVAEVKHFLDNRHLLGSELHVRGPAYRNICIQATLVRSLPPKQERGSLAAAVAHALYQFFDPLTGGPDCKGWPLGRDLYGSEVYQIIEQVPGVDHVEMLNLQDITAGPDGARTAGGADLPPSKQVSVPPYHLINCVVDVNEITIQDPEQMPFVVIA